MVSMNRELGLKWGKTVPVRFLHRRMNAFESQNILDLLLLLKPITKLLEQNSGTKDTKIKDSKGTLGLQVSGYFIMRGR